MAYPNVKGSIILKLLIVIAAAALVMSIFVPKNLWELEKAEEDECHFRMLRLADVQTQYAAMHNLNYADSLEKLIELVETNPEFRARCDSVIQEESDFDMDEKIQNNQPYRMYYDVPVTVDSVFRCPATGEFYLIQWEDDNNYKIVCPTEEREMPVYYFFKKMFYNHGEVTQSKDVSW